MKVWRGPGLLFWLGVLPLVLAGCTGTPPALTSALAAPAAPASPAAAAPLVPASPVAAASPAAGGGPV